MPPPRLLRPLRPHHLRWSSPRVRWASDGPRDRPAAPHGDPPQASNSAKDAHNRGLDDDEVKQPVQTGWLSSIFGRAAGFLGNPSHMHNEPASPQRGRPQLLRMRDDRPDNTVEEEPTKDAVQSLLGNPEGGHNEGLPSYSREQPQTVSRLRANKGRSNRNPATCDVCQTRFDSKMQLNVHTLLSDRCGIDESVYKCRYFCYRCHLTFGTLEAARRHFRIDNTCLKSLTIMKAALHEELKKSPDSLHRIQTLVKAANTRYTSLTRDLVAAAKSFRAMSSPRIRAIPAITKHRLRTNTLEIENLRHSPVSPLKGPLETTNEGNVPTRIQFPGPRIRKLDRPYRKEPNREEPNRKGTQSSHELSPSQWLYSSNTNGKRKHRKAGAVEESVQLTPNKELASNPNEALALQVQKLAEQVRNLTEKLNQPTSPAEMTISTQLNSATTTTKGEAEDVDEHQRPRTEQTHHGELDSQTPEPVTQGPRDQNHDEKQDHSNHRTIEWGKYSFKAGEAQMDKQHKQEKTRLKVLSMNSNPKQGSGSPRHQRGSPNEKFEAEIMAGANESVPDELIQPYEGRGDNQRLSRQIHTQARLRKSLEHQNIDSASAHHEAATESPSQPGASTAVPADSTSREASEQSLLDELFPGANSYIQPHYTGRNPYPKLDPPSSEAPVTKQKPSRSSLSNGMKPVHPFQRSGENITALQLLHCSTELTEADFRRVIPKGKHIEGWMRDGDFIKAIPGRDPISLERLPFYYLLFKSHASALAYQKNASRLHKLSQLHQPSSIMSPIPPPKGFVEDGEDINLATSSFLLYPTGVNTLPLTMVMQPYNASLRALVEQGGYKPIVPFTGANGKSIYKVLMHIEGYEPSQDDLFHLLGQADYGRGLKWPFHNEQGGIHRLRDIGNLRAKLLPVSSANPRAANPDRHRSTEDDPSLSFLNMSLDNGENAAQINQMLMNRVYNRWIIEFDDEEAAKRFARLWNRRVLPISLSAKHVTWRDTEETRMCNTEYLW